MRTLTRPETKVDLYVKWELEFSDIKNINGLSIFLVTLFNIRYHENMFACSLVLSYADRKQMNRTLYT